LARSVARKRSAGTHLAGAAIEGLILEQDGRIRDVNPALCGMVDTRAAALVGRELTSLIRGLKLTAFDQPGEYDLLQADGGSRVVEVLWREGRAFGSHIVAVRELSAGDSGQHQLRRLAQFDPLTGLGNIEMFEHHLVKVLALSDRATVGVAVLSVELDRFDSVRDAIGPLASDQIIINAAQRLQRCVRDTDTVARLGPETFAIIQPLVDRPSDAAVLAERIVADMTLPFEDARGAPLMLSASVGVAMYPDDGTAATDMIRSAGRALSRARQDGCGTWHYAEPKMGAALHDRRSLEDDLREALRDGLLTIAWQPFFDLATMQTAGFEASPRWDHPKRGLISDAVIIPLAAACGLMTPLNRWLVAAACAEAVAWPRPWIVSMTLLPEQFTLPGIVETVAEAMGATGLPANRLEIGIGEATLIAETRNVPEILTGLKRLGVRIAMTDFGAGYSGPGYLRRFAFDAIKLARGLVSAIKDRDGEAAMIVRATVAMARSLRLDVAAGGVETAQELALLKTLGFNFVTGPLLSGGGSASGGEAEPAEAAPVHGGMA
jgi:diguanylate cyclase (GGDEF)-like protein